MKTGIALSCFLPFAVISLYAAEEPQPPVVDPGAPGTAPSAAIVLFDGKDLSKFRGKNSDEPKWKLENGVMETIPGGDANGMFSREEFGDCQVHVEWASPAVPEGDDQGRGNGRSAAAEWIENYVALFAGCLDDTLQQRHRLLRGMYSVLWSLLLKPIP